MSNLLPFIGRLKGITIKFGGYISRDTAVAILIFVVALVLFLRSPMRQINDSKYSLLLSDSLLHHASFQLERYDLEADGVAVPSSEKYQLTKLDSHIYYAFPPGGAVLSIPFLALGNILGKSVVDPTGRYDYGAEVKLQSQIAAFLMAVLAVIFFFIARNFLAVGPSVIATIGGTLGTQVWSTASRGLWADTWGIALLGLVILMLVCSLLGRLRSHPVLLGSVLAWMFFCKPTYWIPIACITVLVGLYQRRRLLQLLASGAVWLGLFLTWSELQFGTVLPPYYDEYTQLGTSTFGEALLGNIISPSRGLLIYVPTVLLVGYLVTRYWKSLPLKPVVA
ncbi:MAG TPA: hypothetical protein VGI80_09010, partial [Pyrinomonadaceae bacterium]